MNSKPGIRDWALAAIGIMFVVMGLVILPHDLNTGVTTIAFFGACAAAGIATIVRKLRYARQSVQGVTVVGGVRIRPSRLRLALFGGGLLGLGAVLLAFSPAAPDLVWYSFWVIAGAGALVLAGVATGLLPNQYIEFTPEGLMFGFRGWAVLLPWDRIARVAAGELHRNPALLLRLDGPETFQVTPPAKQKKFLKYVDQCRGWVGADMFLMTTHFGIDLPLLVAAIGRYMEDREARAGLLPA
ncbi:hypothetical protein GTP81_11690 [Rugamonas sp. FT107W]|uniref:DUF2982 domain-containing protein n=1 Tax=Duganella vulcania TaxID=2692166 RepID=A0A845HLH7_9BURK|nr:hypothetical protein [Duganella vulcania]MYN17416.1 hypothetical protein [Duganella vulcania]